MSHNALKGAQISLKEPNEPQSVDMSLNEPK